MSADPIVQDVATTGTPAVDAVECPPTAEARIREAVDEIAFVCQARVPGGGVCGATERSAKSADMCVRGHFVPANSARRIHGVRAFETTGRLPDVLRQTVEEFRAAVIADRGGAAELSTLESAYVRRLSEVEAVARLLAADLASRGLTTPKGRVRGTFSRWLECLDRWDRLAQRIGTDRRARSMSLAERLAAAPPLTSEAEADDAGE